MKILVTGVAGFIGFHLSKKLLKNSDEILGIDNLNDYYDVKLKSDRLKILQEFKNFSFQKVDISENKILKKVFKEFSPEMVVNLAAQPGVSYGMVNPKAYVDSNLVGFVNVLENCRLVNVKGLVYASSSSVYGSNTKLPFSTKDRTSNPISLYGATKLSNELIARTYSHLYQLPTTGLRFFTVYGSWYRPDMAMYIFIDKIINNKKIKVFNNGNLKRDFTFIEDIVDGIISSINANYDCEIFNLGNNKSEKIIDMIKILEEKLNKAASIEYLPMQPGDVTTTYADINHSIKRLNYNPKTNIDEGIPILINWYRNYHNV